SYFASQGVHRICPYRPIGRCIPRRSRFPSRWPAGREGTPCIHGEGARRESTERTMTQRVGGATLLPAGAAVLISFGCGPAVLRGAALGRFVLIRVDSCFIVLFSFARPYSR